MTYVADRRPLRADALPPLRPQRPAAAGVSLGLWQNFGARPPARDEPRDRAPRVRPRDHALRPREQLRPAVRLGRGELRPAAPRATSRPYRDELVISTKAGYDMWPGPYGEWGSRKYLLASLDQSLARMGLDYVDIFYSHRFDPETPLEETMGALDAAVRAGEGALRRASRPTRAEKTREAAAILRELGTPLLIHQPSYSMLNRWIEHGLLDALGELGVGCIVFSPLAQGMLTDKYLDGIPEGSRASRAELALARPADRRRRSAKIRALNEIAAAPRPDARADGARVDAARPARDVDARSARAASSSSRTNVARARPARLHRRRARRDRPLRDRERHQHLGAGERDVGALRCAAYAAPQPSDLPSNASSLLFGSAKRASRAARVCGSMGA